MNDTNAELSAFVAEKLGGLEAATGIGYGGSSPPRPLDEPLLEDDAGGDQDDADAEAEAIDEATAPPSRGSPSDQAAADVSKEAMADFVESLTAAEYAAVTADPELASTEFRDWLDHATTPQMAERLHRAWLDSGDEDETDPTGAALVAAATAPTSARELVEAVLTGAIPVAVDPVEWILWASTCDRATWRAAAEAAGWPPGLRPSQYDLPPALEAERLRRSLASQRDEMKAGVRRRW